MGNSGYTTLTRQSGLMREMQALAHNVANLSTTGYRRESLVFTEYLRRLDGAEEPLSMASANARQTDETQGTLSQTGGSLDLAIEGDGYFVIETPAGERLTRNGHFMTNADGEMVNADGFRLLDAGGAALFIPPDARAITIGRDGTVASDDQPLGRIGLARPADPAQMRRAGGTLLDPGGELVPADTSILHQGFLEDSNVNPVAEMARMIQIQRAYEMGQKFLDREDERVRGVIQTLGK
ncbi:MAG: flagellar basal-body rod protein FlgF [Rhodobacteraceae bacterium HLUCCA12]|nr:MAG: flagellar basal-body rod protein FlgF [Rhodobacteraceae bacterium HLUCCA12]